jgi:hypothetical protein
MGKGYEIFSELVALILFVSIFKYYPQILMRSHQIYKQVAPGWAVLWECCINIVALKETHISMPSALTMIRT